MHTVRRTARPGRRALVVAGGSRGTGALVASLARSRGQEVTVVDAPGSGRCLRAAIAGAAGVVLVPMRGAESVAARAHAVLEACPDGDASAPHVVLVSGFSVAHGLAHALNTPERLSDLLSAEEIVRSSGRSYTIVRPTWLTNDPPGRYALTFTQEAWADGMISRADLARSPRRRSRSRPHGARRSRRSRSRARPGCDGRGCSLRSPPMSRCVYEIATRVGGHVRGGRTGTARVSGLSPTCHARGHALARPE